MDGIRQLYRSLALYLFLTETIFISPSKAVGIFVNRFWMDSLTNAVDGLSNIFAVFPVILL